jgi:hypothetical protein
LEDDIDGLFTGIMEKGYMLTDGEKLTNPKFNYTKVESYSKISGNAFDLYFAEETEEKIEEDKKVASGDVNKKE